MNKQTILKTLNVFLLIAFFITVSALIFYKFIPSKIQGSEFLYEIHEYGGKFFIFLGICHFILNFSWVKIMYLKRKKK